MPLAAVGFLCSCEVAVVVEGSLLLSLSFRKP